MRRGGAPTRARRPWPVRETHDGHPGRRRRPGRPGVRPCGRPGSRPATRSRRARRSHPRSWTHATPGCPWFLSRATSSGSRCSRPGSWASRVPQPRSPTSSLNTTQTSEEGRSTISGATLFKHVRRRPTLPRGPPRSTIGAEGLNFRVRNGTGCFPFAITAETLLRCHRPSRGPAMATVSREPHSGREIKWSRSQATRPISTGQLHTLPCFHLRPINPVVYWGPYLVNPEGDLILRRASRLDAFSGYPFRT